MQDLKLKECPFCGGEAILTREYIECNGNYRYCVMCADCYISQTEYPQEPKQAIEKWNKRFDRNTF